ncbi:DUF1285 domain-containing protein [Colwellia psychrerythraea]|uniref:DUF1285 domain-containing protein n=1 Tax=Colwellia psychrerythraea TaxID=28229 RepID=A0A099KMI8_COLPS|nr:DUF1285 domain-containing protein [Colwellia psychrerythraea]KGJ91666.1 protein of unknown function DUF1285 [Colwellia psychrerythraea]
MSLDKISAQLAGSKKSLPPVELWNPPYCGEIDIQIKKNGDWYYNGTIFKRLALVKLFADVLIKDVSKGVSDDLSKGIAEYFLVTPVEKVKIQVDDAPFVITQWHWLDEKETVMQVVTNLGDEFTLDAQHPLVVSENGGLYVTVRRNLTAKVHRNVYYQWVDIAKEESTAKGTELIITSAECEFSLGCY